MIPESSGAYVYGTILVATLLAAESPGRESYGETTAAVAVALAVYWLAIAYAESVAHRAQRKEHFSAVGFARVAIRELTVILGALGPLLALFGCWAAGASLSTGVTVAVWCAAGIIAATELILGLRSHLDGADLVVQTGFGTLFGLAVVALRVLLH